MRGRCTAGRTPADRAGRPASVALQAEGEAQPAVDFGEPLPIQLPDALSEQRSVDGAGKENILLKVAEESFVKS